LSSFAVETVSKKTLLKQRDNILQCDFEPETEPTYTLARTTAAQDERGFVKLARGQTEVIVGKNGED
jgi:hypothetical protein